MVMVGWSTSPSIPDAWPTVQSQKLPHHVQKAPPQATTSLYNLSSKMHPAPGIRKFNCPQVPQGLWEAEELDGIHNDKTPVTA